MKEDSKPIENEDLGPIHDAECERMVLASLMTSYNDVAECEPVLDPDCFYDLHHQEIYRAIKAVYGESLVPDLVTVSAQLSKMESPVKAKDLAQLLAQTSIATNPYSYSMRLRELSYRRRLWEIGKTIADGSGREAIDIETLYNDTKNSVDNLFEGLTSNVETLAQTYRELQQTMLLNRDRQPGEIAGTPTGFPYLDSKGGLTPNTLMIIGADTSQGKTSFATAITVSAIRHGAKVAFYSMEMTPVELAARISSMQTGINASRINYESLELAQIYQIDSAMEQINVENLYFDGRSSATLDSIVSSIRQLHRKYGIKGAVIDYLQLISVGEKDLNNELKLAKCAHDMKNLAKELGIWIILISQLSRGDKGRPVPVMSQLRGSGQIEQAADVVMLIYRPEKGGTYPPPYQNVSADGTALVKVSKGRNIGIGEFICGFRPENTLFYPLSPTDLSKLGVTDENVNTSFSQQSSGMPIEDLPF
ncbi:MAG: DNA helicase [Muribaculaceae bacterium]|nr:DNA helicase [Muribaculaceae bacterium]